MVLHYLYNFSISRKQNVVEGETMSGKLSGKTAIVTGASAGIGRECSRSLAAEGAQIVLTARRGERLDAVASEIAALGSKAYIVAGDAREAETAQIAVQTAIDAAGRIDILIN